MDSLNWKILKHLQENARLSNAEIGRRVGISSPAVGERIKKMEDAEIIQGYKTMVSTLDTQGLRGLRRLLLERKCPTCERVDTLGRGSG